MERREQIEIQLEIAALRARSARLLAQSEALREKSEELARKAAETEAARRNNSRRKP